VKSCLNLLQKEERNEGRDVDLKVSYTNFGKSPRRPQQMMRDACAEAPCGAHAAITLLLYPQKPSPLVKKPYELRLS
jgi:hypothetical protein